MLIDTSVFLGPWPFANIEERSPAQVQKHLDAQGVKTALVSHLGAVFAPDPMPANRALFKAVKGRSRFVPVPIINPMLATWSDQLNACRDLGTTLHAVRLLPSYHEISLRSPRVKELVQTLADEGIRLIFSVRLVDSRLDHPALRIQPIAVARLRAWLKNHPEVRPLLSGLTLEEVHALLRAKVNFSADIPFVEWLYSIQTLVDQGAEKQLMFGSNTPFFVTQANVAKLAEAKISDSAREAIAWKNAAEAFELDVGGK